MPSDCEKRIAISARIICDFIDKIPLFGFLS